MSRTLGALADHLAGGSHTTCLLLRLDLRDGTSLGITDHDAALAFDLGDGELTYSASTGAQLSDVVLTAGLEASNCEVSGPIGETFTRAGILGGRFTGARARLFLVDWSALDDRAALLAGKVATARIEGGRFVMEVRGWADAFGQVIGRTLSPYCSADFGDAQCGVVRTAYPCEVTAVASRFQFTVDLGGDHPDDFFTLGSAAFLTGELAGTAEVEVFDYDGASGAVEMFVPLVVAPEVGDTLNLYRGCSKLLKSDDAELPTCLFYDNVANFRGFPEVPGSDQYLKIATPGSGSSGERRAGSWR